LWKTFNEYIVYKSKGKLVVLMLFWLVCTYFLQHLTMWNALF